MYLKSFELKEELYTIKPFSIDFEDGLNLIVGDNGAGKSTFLKLLFNNKFESDIKSLILSENCINKGVESRFFDTEKQNPRLNNDANLIPEGLLEFTVGSRFLSHGETMLPIIRHINELHDKVILIDEPEAGISLANQKIIWNYILAAINNNCQLFISTHSYILIKNTLKVFDMESFKWIDSTEYLKKFEV